MHASRNLHITAILLVLLASPFLRTAAQTPQAGGDTQAPPFSLAIDLPQDIIHGDTEVPLEIIVTNTSTKELAYGVAFGPRLWTYFCQFDVHDNGGKQLKEKSSVRQFFEEGLLKGGSSGPALFLAPGEKMQFEVLLNRVYDLSKPGKYTIQAMRSDNGFTVKSNIVTASVGGAERRGAEAMPRFSVTLSASYSMVKVGYQVPVRVAVTNISKNRIALRTWEEDNHGGAGAGHEFSSGIEVRDALGNPAAMTKEGQDLDGEATFPAGSFRVVWLEPGESYEETRIVGKLYDLSRPGKYEFQVALSDPQTNLVVRSNPVAVEVLGPDGSPQPQAPFLLDIRPLSDSERGFFQSKASVYLAITNRSDHPIDFDIGFGVNEIDVFGQDGKLAPLTEIGRHYGGQGSAGNPPIHNPQTTQHLRPGETGSGGMIKLDALYDLSRPGHYTIQVRAFDGESKTIVDSNRVTVTVDR
jgi:hypothetical protein